MPGHAAGYHIVTRTRGQEYLFDARMKDYIIKLMHKLASLYYVEYGAFALLDNHYHLLVRFRDPDDIDPLEAIERWNAYHEGTLFTRTASLEENRLFAQHELCDVSSFMKRFNYHISLRYNWYNGTGGTIWEGRFRSSIVERGFAFANCAAYIDLNAFRASLVALPEEYKYCSLHWMKSGNADGLLSFDLLREGLDVNLENYEDLFKAYQAFVYQAGASPHKDKPNGIVISPAMEELLEAHSLRIEPGSLSQRIRALIDGKVSGSLRYARGFYEDIINPSLTGVQRRRHEERWVSALASNVWSVCSAFVRGSPN